jgi:hypothetical protein
VKVDPVLALADASPFSPEVGGLLPGVGTLPQVPDFPFGGEAIQGVTVPELSLSTAATRGQTSSTTGSSPVDPLDLVGGEHLKMAVARLRQDMEDPKSKLLQHLDKLTHTVSWVLPGQLTARVAPALLLMIFQGSRSACKFAQDCVETKGLTKHHIGHEFIMLCMLLDKCVMSQDDFINTEACEVLCRRLYALKRAFQNVQSLQDWKQPKGGAGSKWKSKVHWDLIGEIDVSSMNSNETLIPGVEKEIEARLSQKALLAKYLSKLPEGSEEDALNG